MDIDLTPLKTFTTSRPVMYGAPAAALLGVVLGLVFQVGSQTESSGDNQAPSRAYVEEQANPIAWPSGKVPDYVIGTDFLAEAKPRDYAPAIYVEDDYLAQYVPASTPAAEAAPPVVIAARPTYQARPAREEVRWASTEGDILNVRLPDDAPVETALLN